MHITYKCDNHGCRDRERERQKRDNKTLKHQRDHSTQLLNLLISMEFFFLSIWLNFCFIHSNYHLFPWNVMILNHFTNYFGEITLKIAKDTVYFACLLNISKYACSNVIKTLLFFLFLAILNIDPTVKPVLRWWLVSEHNLFFYKLKKKNVTNTKTKLKLEQSSNLRKFVCK